MEESQLIRKEPCPSCGSKDNLARYSDGHAYCFSPGCSHYEPGDGDEPRAPSKEPSKELLQGDYIALKSRGITEETCRTLGYFRAPWRGEPVQVANYYHPESRELVGQKIRTKDKDFKVFGKLHNALFGWQAWPIGGKRIVVTEGEIDALTVSQVQGNKWPVVSIPNGAASAKKAIQANLDYLKKFEEVVLMFDMDEPGRLAAEESAKLLGPRARIAELPRKDANETLLELGPRPILTAIFEAKQRRTAGLYTGEEVLNMGTVAVQEGIPFPWDTVTGWTYGKRPHEMILYGAGTGCGKTDAMKEDIAFNVQRGIKCMTMFLEEPNLQLTIDTIAGKIDGILYHVPGVEFDQEQYQRTRQLVADNLLLFKVEGAIEPEDVLELIREGVEGHGVSQVYLDHVTYILDAMGEAGLDATKLLMRNLNDLNKALPFTLHYVAHLRKKDSKSTSHEEGGRITLDDFAGGKAITQYANFTFGLERSQQSEDLEEKNTTILRSLKDRYTGQSTGQTITLLYDTKTGRKTEHSPFDDETAPAGSSDF